MASHLLAHLQETVFCHLGPADRARLACCNRELRGAMDSHLDRAPDASSGDMVRYVVDKLSDPSVGVKAHVRRVRVFAAAAVRTGVVVTLVNCKTGERVRHADNSISEGVCRLSLKWLHDGKRYKLSTALYLPAVGHPMFGSRCGFRCLLPLTLDKA